MRQPDEERSRDGVSVNRRRVLEIAGATTLASAAFVGTASAHEITEAVFCGCSQVCACGDGKVGVWLAEETSDGFECEFLPIDEDRDSDFSFCHEEEGEDARKVIAIEDGDRTTVCNPNDACAGQALEDCGISCDRDGVQGGPCGEAFLRTCGEGNDRPGRGPER